MLCTKLLISLKTTLKRSGEPCWPAKALTCTHCSTGCETEPFESSPELKIALGKGVSTCHLKKLCKDGSTYASDPLSTREAALAAMFTRLVSMEVLIK